MMAQPISHTDYLKHGIIVDREPNRAGEVALLCPRCSDTRVKKTVRCLSLNIIKGAWHCNHCEWSDGLRLASVEKAKSPPVFSQPLISLHNLSDEAYEYLVADRFIDPEVLIRAGIASTNKPFEIVFPFMEDGAMVNYKVRQIGSKAMRAGTGCKTIMYGVDDIKPDQNLIIVEGELDKLAVDTAANNELACISVPNGANSNLDCLAYLEDKLPKLPQKIILAVDADDPGQQLESELARRIGRERCWRISWPDGCKDANDVLAEHGPAELLKIIQQADPYPVEGIFGLESVKSEILERYHNGTSQALNTGWPQIDKLYTVKTGYWTLITGIPSHGKSGWLDHLAINLAETYDWKFAICSPENQPIETHYSQLIEKRVGKSFLKSVGERMTLEELSVAADWVKERFHMIMPQENNMTIDAILERFRVCIFRYGCRGLIVDPYNELDHSRTGGMTETEYISSFISKIRRFCRANDVHIWLVAHPKKLEPKEIGGEYPVPRPYDIQGSSHWWSKADSAISIWRSLKPNADTSVEIHIQKIKPKYIGRPGLAKLHWDYNSGRYYDYS